jgi:phospholipid transport system transporter-binding protein
VFDLAAVAEVDSSGLAVVFGWSRAAAAAGQTLRIVNPPANLISLAELYGVTELLPL